VIPEAIKIEKSAVGWFRWMGLAGLVLSLVVFALYSGGFLPASLSPSDSAALWSENSKKYLVDTGLSFNPGWFVNSDGYFLSTAALAVLASTALPTLAALAVLWFLRRDYIYGSMAVVISAVLIFAIAG